MSDIQQSVQHAIDEMVESGTELGVQVAVYRGGEQVVDAVTGVADPATGRPVIPIPRSTTTRSARARRRRSRTCSYALPDD
jgi:CubicO group peptidase (beta-lactamase class C family)